MKVGGDGLGQRGSGAVRAAAGFILFFYSLLVFFSRGFYALPPSSSYVVHWRLINFFYCNCKQRKPLRQTRLVKEEVACKVRLYARQEDENETQDFVAY